MIYSKSNQLHYSSNVWSFLINTKMNRDSYMHKDADKKFWLQKAIVSYIATVLFLIMLLLVLLTIFLWSTLMTKNHEDRF